MKKDASGFHQRKQIIRFLNLFINYILFYIYNSEQKMQKIEFFITFYLFIYFFSSIYVDVSFRYLQHLFTTRIEKKYAYTLRIFKRNNFVNLRNFSFTSLHQIPFQNSAS